jgi:hypothetical protein
MSKQRCEKIAADLGGIIHVSCDELKLEAPKNKTVDGDVHEFIYSFTAAGMQPKTQCWKEMLEDLQYMKRMGGFPVCQKKFDLEECEWCDSTFDEAQLIQANRDAAEHLARVLQQARAGA